MGVATIRIMVSLPLVVIVLSCAIGISMHTVTVCLLPLDDEVLHTRLATDRAFTKAYFTCFAERSFRSLENRGTVTGHLTALDWGLNSTVMGRKENLPLDRQRKHCNAARLALRESRKPKLVQDKLMCWHTCGRGLYNEQPLCLHTCGMCWHTCGSALQACGSGLYHEQPLCFHTCGMCLHACGSALHACGSGLYHEQPLCFHTCGMCLHAC